MGFRLVPNSVTLNDLERHNGRYLFIYLFITPQRQHKRTK